MDLLNRVRQTIRRHDLARPETRVLIALSGGPDSVALAYLMQALHGARELCVVGLAHFNHQLRAAAADDERLCEQTAAALGWPLIVDRADVAERARRDGSSIEVAARSARYEFFERARVQAGADVVALGHTRNDQAETFLLRMLRGAGPRGLAGMHPRRDHIVRPLLDCGRADLVAYLDERQIARAADETNEDLSIPRNRVRAVLLPLLRERFNPSIVDTLAAEAELAREDWLFLQQAADSLGAGSVSFAGDRWYLDAAALNAAPPAVARLVLHAAMTDASGGRTVSFDQVASALEVSRGERGALDAPGHRVERVGARLVLRSRQHAADLMAPFRHPLSVPGEVEAAGAVISAELAPGDAGRALLGNSSTAALAAVIRPDRVQGQLAVRNRRPGDRFRPLGLDGRKKLQDYFVDRKVPRMDRDAVPLVVDGADRIVWVAGHAIDAEFRVTDPVQAVLILRLRRSVHPSIPGGSV